MSFRISLREMETKQPLRGSEMHPYPRLSAALLHGKASHVIFRSLSLPYKSRSLATGGSMSLDFRVTAFPYKSSSFATPEGEVCSMLKIYLIRCGQHFGD
jgi:hypothetical protein